MARELSDRFKDAAENVFTNSPVTEKEKWTKGKKNTKSSVFQKDLFVFLIRRRLLSSEHRFWHYAAQSHVSVAIVCDLLCELVRVLGCSSCSYSCVHWHLWRSGNGRLLVLAGFHA